jgi:hypothetical protein
MFGWYVFAGAMLVYFLIVRKIEPPESAPKPIESVSSLARSSLALGLALAFGGLALGPLLGLWAGSARAAAPDPTELLPSDPDPWAGPVLGAQSEWSPVFVGADVAVQGTYRRFDETVDLYIAAYEHQTQKKELVGYANSLISSTTRVVSRKSIVPRGVATELVVQTRAGQKYVLCTSTGSVRCKPTKTSLLRWGTG